MQAEIECKGCGSIHKKEVDNDEICSWSEAKILDWTALWFNSFARKSKRGDIGCINCIPENDVGN